MKSDDRAQIAGVCQCCHGKCTVQCKIKRMDAGGKIVESVEMVKCPHCGGRGTSLNNK